MPSLLTDFIGNVKLNIALTSKKELDLSAPEDVVKQAPSISLSFGTGDGKGNLLYHDQKVLTPSQTYPIDLVGVLKDAFGDVLSFTKVKGIIVVNTSPDQGIPTEAEIGVGGNAAEFLNWCAVTTEGTEINIRAGGFFALCCDDDTGYAPGAGADMLDIINRDAVNSAQYDVYIFGEGTSSDA